MGVCGLRRCGPILRLVAANGNGMNVPIDLAKKALEGRVSMACLSRTKAKCAYRTGHDYALQSGKRTLGRLTVLDVKASTTPDLTLQDARKLGFRTRTDFYERWKGQETIWLIRFVMGVHVDTPRLLAKRCGTHSGDYVSSASQALPETAEEVSSGLQSRYAAEAVVKYQITQAERSGRLQMALETIRKHGGKGPATNQKLRDAQAKARQHGDRVVYDVG